MSDTNIGAQGQSVSCYYRFIKRDMRKLSFKDVKSTTRGALDFQQLLPVVTITGSKLATSSSKLANSIS